MGQLAAHFHPRIRSLLKRFSRMAASVVVDGSNGQGLKHRLRLSDFSNLSNFQLEKRPAKKDEQILLRSDFKCGPNGLQL
jgi:hypothetical protein